MSKIDNLIEYLKDGSVESVLQFKEGDSVYMMVYLGGFFIEKHVYNHTMHETKIVSIEPMSEEAARFALTARYEK